MDMAYHLAIIVVSFKCGQWVFEKHISSCFYEYPAFYSNVDSGEITGTKWDNQNGGNG